MADIASLGIKIDSNQVTTADNRLKGLSKSGEGAEQSTKKLESSWSKFSKTIITLNQGMQLARQVFGTINSALTKLNDAWESNAVANVKLENALRATNNAAGINIDEMRSMAAEMSNLTGIADTEISSMQGLMVTFTSIGKEVFPDAMKAAADMSTMFGQDLQQSVIQLGTALNDPIAGVGRLRRIGVSFTETQQEMIRGFVAQNDIMSAQNVILAELNREFGGAAEAVAEITTGSDKLRNAFTHLREEGGGFVHRVLEPLKIYVAEVVEGYVALRRESDAITNPTGDLGLSWLHTTSDEVATLKRELTSLEGAVDLVKKQGFYRRGNELFLGDLGAEKLQEDIDGIRSSIALLEGNLQQMTNEDLLNAFFSETEIAKTEQAIADLQATYGRFLTGDWIEGPKFNAIMAEYFAKLNQLKAKLDELRYGDLGKQAELSGDPLGRGLLRLVPEFNMDLEIQRQAADNLDATFQSLAGDMNAYYNNLKPAKDATELLTESIKQLGDDALWQGIGLAVDSFNELGAALVSTGDEMKSFGDIVINLTTSMLGMISGVLVTIAQKMAESGNWAGALGVLAAAAGIKLFSGAVSGVTNNAQGNAYDQGNIIPFSRGAAFTNQIIDRPTIFPMARGAGLMGEAGPEAILPLTRTASGDLGVKGGGTQVNVRVENYTSAEVSTERRQTPNGEELVFIVKSIMRGAMNSGDLDGALKQNYDVRRRGIA